MAKRDIFVMPSVNPKSLKSADLAFEIITPDPLNVSRLLELVETDFYEPSSNAGDDNPGFPVVQQSVGELCYL